MAATGTLVVQQIGRTGLVESFTAGSLDGHYFPNDGRVLLHIKNTGSQITATIITPGKSQTGQAITDQTATIPATSGDMLLGPFPTAEFNDGAGRALLNLSAVTGVTVSALRI
jgi:hypothetical protein